MLENIGLKLLLFRNSGEKREKCDMVSCPHPWGGSLAESPSHVQMKTCMFGLLRPMAFYHSTPVWTLIGGVRIPEGGGRKNGYLLLLFGNLGGIARLLMWLVAHIHGGEASPQALSTSMRGPGGRKVLPAWRWGQAPLRGGGGGETGFMMKGKGN